MRTEPHAAQPAMGRVAFRVVRMGSASFGLCRGSYPPQPHRPVAPRKRASLLSSRSAHPSHDSAPAHQALWLKFPLRRITSYFPPGQRGVGTCHGNKLQEKPQAVLALTCSALTPSPAVSEAFGNKHLHNKTACWHFFRITSAAFCSQAL